MTYSVGNSTVANYANTSSGKVTNVVANNGVGGSGEAVNVVDRAALSFVIATNMQYPTINVSAIPGYIAGKSDLTITVNAGVYVYGYSFSTYNSGINPVTPYSATMNIIGGTPGDTIKLVNNGYILGAGGDGGGAVSGQAVYCCCCISYYQWNVVYSTPGQAAIEITYPLILENNGYIAGGGGGGAYIVGDYTYNYSVMGGGGGAGGGLGIDRIGTVSTRAVPPNSGNNGQQDTGLYGPCACTYSFFLSGGGGGFVLLGVGGTASTGFQSLGNGGGSGGSGSAYDPSIAHVFNNNGGTANGVAPEGYSKFSTAIQSGGGGGWGATGARSVVGNFTQILGEPGGNSIITNGNAITTITAGTRYGAIRTTGTTYVQTLSSSATTTYVTIPVGYQNAIIIVPTGVTLRSDNVYTAALVIDAELNAFGDSDVSRLKIIVNGAVLGKGGSGGDEYLAPEPGGTAIEVVSLAVNESITLECTYGYVAGGGGGGGYVLYSPSNSYYLYGGGGAGGGDSGATGTNPAYGATTVGTSGDNGTTAILCGSDEYTSGGGGGLILPGTSVSLGLKNTAAAFPGIGGSGGGSGAARKLANTTSTFLNNGGGFNQSGGTGYSGVTLLTVAGGGGGGWGASGGSSRRVTGLAQSGALGGAALNAYYMPVYIINSANIAGQVF